MFHNMLYYSPDEYGLETVAQFDRYEPDYDFDMVAVWRSKEDGKLWAAADSGCSCPTPFEDHTWPTDFTEVRSLDDVKALVGNLEDSYRAANNPLDFYNTVREALA